MGDAGLSAVDFYDGSAAIKQDSEWVASNQFENKQALRHSAVFRHLELGSIKYNLAAETRHTSDDAYIYFVHDPATGRRGRYLKSDMHEASALKQSYDNLRNARGYR